MFATIDIEIGTPKNYVTLPKTAIYYNSYGDIAYLVEKAPAGSHGGKHDTAHQVL